MLNYVLSIMLFFVSFVSFGADFVAGKDYEIIKNGDASTKAAGPISVTEFFSFGCPWCYRLEPTLNHWVEQQGAKIAFKKVPVVFKKDWEYYAKAYYTAQALSLNSTLDPLLFKAVLQDKQLLNSDQAMVDFFAAHGVDKAIAQSAFSHSLNVEMEITAGQALMARYHVSAIPALVINNQFKTDLQMAKTEERLIAILDFLLTQTK